jgi:hypothetical protein
VSGLPKNVANLKEKQSHFPMRVLFERSFFSLAQAFHAWEWKTANVFPLFSFFLALEEGQKEGKKGK